MDKIVMKSNTSLAFIVSNSNRHKDVATLHSV